MVRDNPAAGSFMQRLLRDTAANTLAITAAALLPLLALVGGGIDAGRYYAATARLQAACDSGALAARQAMLTDTFTAAHRQTAFAFFDQNFEDGMFGTTGRTREYTASSSGIVSGTASATLPTSIMQVFGFTSFSLQVSCSSEVNIANTDVMFVLDVTGSMADCPNNTACGGGAGSKIVGLRSAVMSFYDSVQAASSPAAQLRYGIVPYSQQANVGFSIPREYMTQNHSYQSRVARFNAARYPNNSAGDVVVVSDQTEWLPRLVTNLNSPTTDHYRYRTDGAEGTTARSVCTTYPGSYTVSVDGANETWQVFAATEFVLNQWPDNGDANNRAGCRARVRKTRPLTEADVTASFRDWVYCQVTTGTSAPCGITNPARSPAGWESVTFASIYTGNSINLPLGTNGAMTSVSWGGCVEEPNTVQTDVYNPIPSGAYDLDINLVPDTEAERWRPALIGATWLRYANGAWTRSAVATTDPGFPRPNFVCPPAARKLAPITRSQLQAYVDGLTPQGQTYHDIGMIWGARFLSPRGMFAAENTTAPNGDPIARHLVFMTDGAQVNDIFNYSSHGIEGWDRRITGTGNGTTEFNRRAARLQAICNAAKQENITVWVVAFGTTLTQNLIDCASSGRAFQASDSAALTARFQEIAQKIAALRLTS